MKFIMFVCTDPSAEPYSPEHDNIEAWVAEYDGSGVRVAGDRLQPAEASTTVRIRQGKRLVEDGRSAITPDWIAGFDILDCANLDQAIEVAAKHPMARFGRIEIRPFWIWE